MKLPEQLMEKLVCPQSKEPLEYIDDERIQALNLKIQAGEVQTTSGEVVKKPVDALLCCRASKLCYQVVERIPNMLVEEALPLSIVPPPAAEG